MIKYLFQCFFVVLFFNQAVAQTTYTVQPDGTTGIDAWVLSEYTPNNDTSSNFGTDARLDAWRWTNSGVPYTTRGYLKFDVSSLPTSAVVCSAVLTVHTDANNEMSGHTQPNAFYLKRATSLWTETGITWHNQPSLSTTDIISVGSFTSTTTGTSYTIDVSSHIQNMINNPSTNYGWAIMLQNEVNTYAALGLASSDHATAAYRPMLTVVYVPSLTVTPTSATVCAGGSTTLTVSGASTYSWTPPSSGLSASTGTSVVATPSASITYTVTGTTGSCAVATKTISVTVNPLPTVSVSPSATATICKGSSITFTASGASTYTWTPNTSLTCSVCASPIANPTATTNYTVTGTNSNGCINTKAVTLTVNPTPTVTVNSPDTIYGSQTATLTATGASTYSWTPATSLSATTGSTVIASPTVTTIYTVTGTGANTCTASATANVVNLNLYFRSAQTGNWSTNTTWQSSPDNTTWSAATLTPTYKSHAVTIQSGHKVTIASSVTIDETVVNGSLIYGNSVGNNLTINDGTGTDLTINGSFQHNSPDSVIWLASSTWSLGASDTLLINTNTTGQGWRTKYAGGISSIPASANWILNKTGTVNPTLYSNTGMYYPNLIIQNTTGTTWTTSTSSSFTGSATPPTIKGNLNIGGSGGISFLSNNTNASPVLVQGSFTLATGSTLRNQGTGFEIQGNINLNGADSTTSSSVIKLSGSNQQTLSGSNLNFRNLRIHKATSVATVSLTAVCTIRGSLQLDTGVIVSDTTHLLTFNAGSTTTGVNDSSFVSGPVKKIGNTAFTFPLGKHTNSQTIAISAPTYTTDAFQAEYFDSNPVTVYGSSRDTTFNYISTCQYFKLLRKAGTSNIQPTLGYDATSCISNLLPTPTVIGYNGTKWKDLGIDNLTYSMTGGTVSTASVITQYGAITLGSFNPLITGTPNGDTCFAAIPMPVAATSTLTGQTQSTGYRWYTFTPTTPEIKITLTNTSMGSNHIHDLVLLEGTCSVAHGVGYDSSRTDTTLTIILHEALVGTPYFLTTFKNRADCGMCSPAANFSLKVESLTPPVQSVSGNLVSLNGIPSHMSEHVIIRVDKAHLTMSNVNNTSLLGGTASQFFDNSILGSIASVLFNSDTSQAGNLTVKKIYPDLTSADTISLSRDSQYVQIPAFYENFLVYIPKNTKIFYTSRLLSVIPGIKYTEPNFAVVLAGAPNDADYGSQASLHLTGSYVNHINVENAWNITTGLPFVKIGVYDSGIDGTHSELNGSKIAGGNDYMTSTNTPISSGTNNDSQGHGTNCAGIIGAYRNNSAGIAGIAGGDAAISNSGCSLYDMKIFNSNSFTSFVGPAITNGATGTSAGGFGLHIMNHSWTQSSPSSALHDAIAYAAKNGVVVVAARGNYYPSSDASNCEYTGLNLGAPVYPACFQDEMVINVGASGTDGEWKTNTNGDPAGNVCEKDYSSMTGSGLDVIAPGTSALGFTTQSGTNSYVGFGGTSAATPHVAGVAGLMLSYFDAPAGSVNNLVVEDVENILQNTAVDKSASPAQAHYDVYTGYGLIDATAALNAISAPTYKIQHFGVGQNVTSSSIVQSTVLLNTLVNLPNPYGGLAAGYYQANIYLQTITLHFNLSASSDVMIGQWPRFSSTLGWNYTAVAAGSAPPVINTDNWCQIVSVTPPTAPTQAVLKTYIYEFIGTGGGGTTPPGGTLSPLGANVTYPTTNPRAALSIYTQNSSLTGVSKINSTDDLALGVYPNPATNNAIISVNLLKAQPISLELYDVQGNLIKNIVKEKTPSGLNHYELSLTDVAPGIYYVRLISDETTCSKKLIVVK